MSFEEPTDLEILQRRVGSAEILLTLVCQQLTEEQKDKIEYEINQRLQLWKNKDAVEDYFNGALDILKNKI